MSDLELPPANDPLDTETDAELLFDTQRYLQRQLRRINCDPELQRCWERFYRIYSRVLRRLAVSLGVPTDELDNCVQEVWLAVIRKLSEGGFDRRRGRFRTWLYALVRNKAVDLIRRQKRQLGISLYEAFPADGEPAGGSPDPARALELQWTKEMVHVALKELREEEIRRRKSDTNYRILFMCDIQGRRHAEVGRRLGLTAEEVRKRLSRTRHRFREILRSCTQGDFGSAGSFDEH